jgi:drug/metabolite transporter (DMT)-like permease
MSARPLDAFAATLVFVLCIIWGFNQVAVKLALADVGPIVQTGVRSGIGALCVLVYALATKRPIFEIDGTEFAGALAGALFTAEFFALYESLRFTTAARATVFLYSAPFLVALGAAFLIRDERLKAIQWVGLAFAFVGVVSGFVGRTEGGSLEGDALALLAAALWAATTLVIKATPLRRIDPIKILLYQVGFAALAAPLAAYAFGESWPTRLSMISLSSLIWQGAVVAGLSYALWFRTLVRYSASELSAFIFITPLVGVLAGWLVFGETVTWGFALAIVLVLAGLALVNWPRGRLTE